MIKGLLIISFLAIAVACDAQQSMVLQSPDKKIKVELTFDKQLRYSVFAGGEVLMRDNQLNLYTGNDSTGVTRLIKKKYSTVDEVIRPVVPLKRSTIDNHCNVLRLDFNKNISVEFRAYDNGIAYRFLMSAKDSVNISNETALFNFNSNAEVVWSEAKHFKNDYQVLYEQKKLDAVPPGQMSILPVSVASPGYKLMISEADLHEYPCMFLKNIKGNALQAVFPMVPVEFGEDGDRSVSITKEADYIARVAGSRSFPWRFFLITDKDERIPENTMVANLSAHPALPADFSWVKPGQVVWEWWHDARVYGVDFKTGYNQKTYEYYIDFASSRGIPYILMDEGWAKTTLDPFTPNPTINLHELIEYGRKKNVKILLWFTWLAVERNPAVFKTLHDWGIAGMKIDFMDRSDQWMVNYYERVAKQAARHQLLVDFHGAFKPAGLEMLYPNVLSYEGVVGMEMNIWSGTATPNNNLYLPFLRNAVGPMDYTPGAMVSVHPKDYFGNRTNTVSIGTRAHQLAIYVVFESGLQMLADNPYNYLREKDALDFITSVPVTWDDTRVLKAEEGQYIVVAKRKGDKWFIGGMTNSKARDLSLALDFLPGGKSYKMTIISDGVNAAVQAMDYKKTEVIVHPGDRFPVNMVADGGYAAIIESIQ